MPCTRRQPMGVHARLGAAGLPQTKGSVPPLRGAVAEAGTPHPPAASKHQLAPSWDPMPVSVWHRAHSSPSQNGLWADVPKHRGGRGPPAASPGAGRADATGARAGKLSPGAQRLPLPGEPVTTASQDVRCRGFRRWDAPAPLKITRYPSGPWCSLTTAGLAGTPLVPHPPGCGRRSLCPQTTWLSP